MSDQESFISHLIELRERLMKAVGAVLVGLAAVWTATRPAVRRTVLG